MGRLLLFTRAANLDRIAIRIPDRRMDSAVMVLGLILHLSAMPNGGIEYGLHVGDFEPQLMDREILKINGRSNWHEFQRDGAHLAEL